jgi:hypothetical protein
MLFIFEPELGFARTDLQSGNPCYFWLFFRKENVYGYGYAYNFDRQPTVPLVSRNT